MKNRTFALLFSIAVTSLLYLSGCESDFSQPASQTADTSNKVASPVTTFPAPTGGTEEPLSENQAPEELLIKETLELAKQGKVMNNEFAADTTLIEDVYKKWGKPDKQEAAGKGLYDMYTERGVAFGFNKGSQVFDVRSYDPKLKTITYHQVIKVLGKPTEIRHVKDQEILVYQVNDKFQLKFIFPKPTTQTSNPTLDHISVFSPRAATNLMLEG